MVIFYKHYKLAKSMSLTMQKVFDQFREALHTNCLREQKNQNKGWFRSGSLVNIILYTYKGIMIQFKYKYLKINGDVNITGNRRALAEGKEASISFHSESKCFFFPSWGYSTKL